MSIVTLNVSGTKRRSRDYANKFNNSGEMNKFLKFPEFKSRRKIIYITL